LFQAEIRRKFALRSNEKPQARRGERTKQNSKLPRRFI
jgi:hypothetical protein